MSSIDNRRAQASIRSDGEDADCASIRMEWKFFTLRITSFFTLILSLWIFREKIWRTKLGMGIWGFDGDGECTDRVRR